MPKITFAVAVAVVSTSISQAAPSFQTVTDGQGVFTQAYLVVRTDSPETAGGSNLQTAGTATSGTNGRHAWPFTSSLSADFSNPALGLVATNTTSADYSIAPAQILMTSAGTTAGDIGQYTGSVPLAGLTRSEGRVRFALTEPTMVRIEASVSAQPLVGGQPASGANFFRFTQNAGVTSISDFNVGYGVTAPASTNVGLSFDQIIMLNAGTYTIAHTRFLEVMPPTTSWNLSSEAFVKWTIVPAPSTMVMTGLVGLAMGGRRRSGR